MTNATAYSWTVRFEKAQTLEPQGSKEFCEM
jgi:hypothetical protein